MGSGGAASSPGGEHRSRELQATATRTSSGKGGTAPETPSQQRAKVEKRTPPRGRTELQADVDEMERALAREAHARIQVGDGHAVAEPCWRSWRTQSPAWCRKRPLSLRRCRKRRQTTRHASSDLKLTRPLCSNRWRERSRRCADGGQRPPARFFLLRITAGG